MPDQLLKALSSLTKHGLFIAWYSCFLSSRHIKGPASKTYLFYPVFILQFAFPSLINFTMSLKLLLIIVILIKTLQKIMDFVNGPRSHAKDCFKKHLFCSAWSFIYTDPHLLFKKSPCASRQIHTWLFDV